MKMMPLYLLIAVAIGFVPACTKKGEITHDAPKSAPTPTTEGTAPKNDSPAPVSGGPRKWALLVGINNYKYPDRVSPLAGSINDIENMKSVLVGKFEFPPENIFVLKDAEATHAGIVGAIQNQLIAKAQKDDIILFHYSGHGSQMKDDTGKQISGLEETIVPYDSRDPNGQVFDITGAELHGLLLQLAAKTKNITFILDSCHSGRLVRGARVRGIKADNRKPPDQPPPYAVATRRLGEAGSEPSLRYAFIAAATSRESAFEHLAGGKEYGALTYFLVQQLRNSGSGITYRDVMDKVNGIVTANYPSQHPQLEGAAADQFVFGDASSLSRTFVTAVPLTGTRVSLGAGQVQGASIDSVYDIYNPGTKKFAPPDKPIATAQITSISPYTAEAKLISGTNIPQYSRAVEREHRYGSSKLRVFFDGLEGSPRLQSISAALTLQPYIELVNDPATCHIQIRETEGKVLTLAADATTLSSPVPSNATNLVDRLLEQVKGWAKWFSVLSINNAMSDVAVEFSIKPSETRDLFARVGRPDFGVFEDERIEVSITNLSMKDLYLSLLDLSGDGSISVVYPSTEGASEVLKPGLTLSKTFTTVVPKGRSIVTDILKVFASSKPIDLNSLTGAAIKEAPAKPDPLQSVLEAAVGNQRGIVAVDSKPISLSGWTTAQRVLVVKRRK